MVTPCCAGEVAELNSAQRLFAIEEFELSARALKAPAGKSVELELKENEKKQVSVTVISSDEGETALQKTVR